jgi:hypothetical protein
MMAAKTIACMSLLDLPPSCLYLNLSSGGLGDCAAKLLVLNDVVPKEVANLAS